MLFPFSRPIYVMAKPVGGRCNLTCDYCYYADKEAAATGSMDDDLLETFTRQYIEAQTQPQILFTWHGGEPLLRPIAFYERALQLQRKYARGRQIDNCLQTNGTLLTPEWCRFLRSHHFLVGISIDGPEHLHNAFRHHHAGQGTFSEVMRGIRLLQHYGVEWNAMATVNNINASQPRAFYRFFKEIGCRYLQFTPVGAQAPLLADGVSPAHVYDRGAVSAAQWGQFLCEVYDEWAREDVGRLFVQLFDATLANWVGEPPGVCSMAPTCGQVGVMLADGSVYSCDHFVFPPYRLGHLREHTLTQLMYGKQQQAFGRGKLTTLTRECRECRFRFACHGECPRNRVATDCYGERGHNYLCAGYKRFFAHVAADMDLMAAQLAAGLPPSLSADSPSI